MVPVPARLLVLAHLPVLAQRPREAELPALAPLVLEELQVVVGLAQLPVLAHLVVEAVVPRDLLSHRSRRSFSAARARSSP